MFKRLVLIAALTAPLAAAPAQASPALIALQEMDQRVATIGHRLARANLDLCGARTMPLSGLLVHAIEQYGEDARAGATASFGLGAEPSVLAVVPGSAAARAGLQPGDAILSIGGGRFPPPATPRSNRGLVRARPRGGGLFAAFGCRPATRG